jgi:phosphohistidine phosphatase
MPKHLFLLRHAESVDKQLRQQDKERELSTAGIKESLQIGYFLAKEKISLDVIITSSATRTRATTQLVADAIKFHQHKIVVEDELYDASVRTFFQYILNLDEAYHAVMCVGHNPTISYLSEFLTKAEIGTMATGGLAVVKFNISSWKEITQGSGELINYIYPSMLLT